jgi:hypothetical protein
VRPRAGTLPWRPWAAAAAAHELMLLAAWWIVRSHASAAYLQVNMWNGAAAHFLVQYDSLYFLAIARHGYLVPGLPAGAATVFFPWVPLLLWATRTVGAFLLLQQVAFFTCCWLLYRAAERWRPNHDAFRVSAVWFFALNPALVFYSAPYAELWTMLGALAALEWWDAKRPGAAGLVSVATALTQASGLLVGALPLVEAVRAAAARRWKAAGAAAGWGSGLLLGIGLYAWYLGTRFGHPLWFSAQEGSPWWRAGFHVPFAGVLGGLRLAILGSGQYAVLVAMALLLLAGLTYAAVAGWRARRPLAAGTALYAGLGVLLSVSFGTAGHPLHSTVRLLSDYFPAYFGLAALATSARIRGVLLALSGFMGAYGAALFLHGFFFQ